ncbi:MAG: carboxypeptidase regulatory-like domain-containing protein [Thermoplasmata archaeon]
MARDSVCAAVRAFAIALFVSGMLSVAWIVDSDGRTDAHARVLQASFTVSINVTVTDDVGRAIPGAIVHIVGNATTWQTGEAGYALIEELADDNASYTLWAEKTGYRASSSLTVPVMANETTNVTLQVFGGTVYGWVLSPTGPISGATVTIAGLGYTTEVSSDDGNYSILGVPGGTHSVTASAPGYLPNTTVIVLAVGGVAPASFVLTPQNGWISGYVLHSDTMAPLSGANISVTLADRTVTVQSGDDGGYIIRDVPEGTYTVTALKDGFYPGVLPGINVTRGNGTVNVNFTLEEKPTKLFGLVTSGAFLVPGVNVSVVGTPLFNVTNAKGEFLIENISAGTYTVMASMVGYETAVIGNVTIETGGETRLDISLVALPGAILRGTVVSSVDGSPLVTAIITLSAPGYGPITTTTNVNGGFEFTGLAAGNYTVQIEMKGYKPLELSKVTVSEETVTNLSFVMEPLRKGYEGFIFGFDIAHSMMIIGLFATILILAIAIYLRIRTFQSPETAPAVYDQAEEVAEGVEEQPETAGEAGGGFGKREE